MQPVDLYSLLANDAAKIRLTGACVVEIDRINADKAFRRHPLAFDLDGCAAWRHPADLAEIRDQEEAPIDWSMRTANRGSQTATPSVKAGRRSAASVSTGRSLFNG